MASDKAEPKVLRPTSLGNLKIAKAQDQEYISAIIFGRSGAGKTVLAGSASLVPEMSPVLFLDPEQGTLSLRGRYDDVDVVSVTKYNDYAEIHRALRERKIPYKTLVIDSITEMAMVGLEEIVGRSVMTARDRGKEHDPEQPDQADWYRNGLRMHKVIRFFRALPCHTIFTALERIVEIDGKQILVPALNTTRLSAELPGAVDEVWYYYTKDRKDKSGTDRILLTDSAEKILAKDRSGTLPKFMQNPTMQDIFNHFNSKNRNDTETENGNEQED